MTLQFVPAPKDRAADAVPLMYSSGTEMFEYLFSRRGQTALEFLQQCYVQDDGLFSHRRHTAVLNDGELVGIGSFYSGVEYNKMSQHMGKHVLQFMPKLALPGLLSDFRYVSKWMRPPPKRMQYIANLGVAASARGQGVGTALIAHERQQALAAGKSIYALDVADNNPKAQALYERLGFIYQDEMAYLGPVRGTRIPTARRLQQAL